MKNRTIARYPGTCQTCREPIELGDNLKQDEDEVWVHAECATSERARLLYTMPEMICPECHLTRPCEHDDN